jgi:hypothetical protein
VMRVLSMLTWGCPAIFADSRAECGDGLWPASSLMPSCSQR